MRKNKRNETKNKQRIHTPETDTLKISRKKDVNVMIIILFHQTKQRTEAKCSHNWKIGCGIAVGYFDMLAYFTIIFYSFTHASTSFIANSILSSLFAIRCHFRNASRRRRKKFHMYYFANRIAYAHFFFCCCQLLASWIFKLKTDVCLYVSLKYNIYMHLIHFVWTFKWRKEQESSNNNNKFCVRA